MKLTKRINYLILYPILCILITILIAYITIFKLNRTKLNEDYHLENLCEKIFGNDTQVIKELTNESKLNYIDSTLAYSNFTCEELVFFTLTNLKFNTKI